MSAFIKVGLTPESRQGIAKRGERSAKFRAAMKGALREGLEDMASHLKMTKLRGGSVNEARGGKSPTAVRSGALLQSIVSKVDQPMGGFVGSSEGPASKYARTILGGGTTTITPKNAKHLWIPIADNRTRSGQMRITPSELFSMRGPKGGKLITIFKSKAGNLVAGMKDGKVPGVKRKGFKLLFVLKDSIEIQGTDALAEAVTERQSNLRGLLADALKGSLEA